MKTVNRVLVSTVATALSLAAAQSARASLIISYQFAGGATNMNIGAGDVGTDVPVQVWAQVNGSGTMGFGSAVFRATSQQVGGGALTSGGVAAAGFAAGSNFGNVGSVGTAADINGDGIIDLGQASGNVVSAVDAKARAVTAPSSAVAPGWYVSQGGWSNVTATSASIQIGSFTVHIGGLGAGGATTTFKAAVPIAGTAAGWFEGAVSLDGKSGARGAATPAVVGVYTVGTSVTFTATGGGTSTTSPTFNYALTTHNDATLGTIHSKSLTVVGSNKNYNDPTAADFVPADPVSGDYAIANANLGVGGETPVLVLVDFNLGSMTIADLRNALVSVGDVAPSSIFGPADADNTGQRALLLSQYPSFVGAETLMFKFDALPGAVADGLHFGFDLTGSGVSVNRTIAVPEPASMGLLALGSMGLISRRRKASR